MPPSYSWETWNIANEEGVKWEWEMWSEKRERGVLAGYGYGRWRDVGGGRGAVTPEGMQRGSTCSGNARLWIVYQPQFAWFQRKLLYITRRKLKKKNVRITTMLVFTLIFPSPYKYSSAARAFPSGCELARVNFRVTCRCFDQTKVRKRMVS